MFSFKSGSVQTFSHLREFFSNCLPLACSLKIETYLQISLQWLCDNVYFKSARLSWIGFVRDNKKYNCTLKMSSTAQLHPCQGQSV